MVAHRENLSQRQRAAILALLQGPTIADAAKAVRVGETTLHRWLKEPAFREALKAARREVMEAALGRLQGAVTKAVDTLERNLSCGNPSTEVRAALGILDQAVKVSELMDLEERLAKLEAQYGHKS